MGCFGRRIEYFYVLKGNNDDTLKYGPYNFNQMAMVYKELQIDKDTLIWTNEKVWTDGRGRRTRPPHWTKIRDMPDDFRERLEQSANSSKDRRAKLGTSADQGPPHRGRNPPPVPIL